MGIREYNWFYNRTNIKAGSRLSGGGGGAGDTMPANIFCRKIRYILFFFEPCHTTSIFCRILPLFKFFLKHHNIKGDDMGFLPRNEITIYHLF